MTTDILKNIDRRLGQLQGEITKLEAARTALTNGTRVQVTPKPRAARRTRAKTAPQIVPAGKLTTLLAGTEGLTTRELANTTDGEQSQILALLRELEQADQVRRSGQRRGTRWHLNSEGRSKR
jgi:hypothetical protein